jgi:hypothetical protein
LPLPEQPGVPCLEKLIERTGYLYIFVGISFRSGIKFGKELLGICPIQSPRICHAPIGEADDHLVRIPGKSPEARRIHHVRRVVAHALEGVGAGGEARGVHGHPAAVDEPAILEPRQPRRLVLFAALVSILSALAGVGFGLDRAEDIICYPIQ